VVVEEGWGTRTARSAALVEAGSCLRVGEVVVDGAGCNGFDRTMQPKVLVTAWVEAFSQDTPPPSRPKDV